MADRSRSLLVLAGAAVADMQELPASVRELLDAAGYAFVVTPPLPSRVQWLMSDTDEARRRAGRRLAKVLSQLRSAGVRTAGTVGDDTPLTAIEDHVRAFGPDHILVALRNREHADWQERGLLRTITESFGVPVTTFAVDAGGRALEPLLPPSTN